MSSASASSSSSASTSARDTSHLAKLSLSNIFPELLRIQVFLQKGTQSHLILKMLFFVFNIFYCVFHTTTVHIQDFPEGVAPTPKSAIIFQFFGRKLHENEGIWTPRGEWASLAPPLDPPMNYLEEVGSVKKTLST